MAATSHRGIAGNSRATDSSAAHALILGDWGWLDVVGPNDLRGGNGFAAQMQVAQGMRHYAASLGLTPEALFLLGDSWYGDLADGAQSPRWKTQFERMYPAELFPGPAYTMLGNHDYQRLPPMVDKVEAELEYARTGRGLDGRPTRWTLPARWYTFDFPAKNPVMHCIVLDSNMPAPDGRASHGANFTLTPAQQAEQLQWLEQQLQRPRTAPFLIVMGHHPVYSNGPHGDHPVLVRDWDPLFLKYKVDLYMAGHDHDLQVLQFEDHPTTHFLSGGGGADLYVLKIDDLQRGPYAQEVHGFSHLSATKHALELRHLDASGRFLFGIRKSAVGQLQILST
ncbi:MAG: metallophosphoesterase [Janthinobacterium lividum]